MAERRGHDDELVETVTYSASYGDDPYPSTEAVARAADALRFELAPAEPPSGVRGLIEAWQAVAVNGGAFTASFTVLDLQPAAEWFFRNDRLEQLDFTRRLLTSAAMTEALPDHDVDATQLAQARFAALSPLQLDGDIAVRLLWGGAHVSFPGTAAQAKAIGSEATAALIGDRYEDFTVSTSSDAWAPWFGWVAWDRTWIITDRSTRTCTVIGLTDTD